MSTLRLLAAICLLFAFATNGASAFAQGSPTIAPDRQILVMVQHPPDHFRPSGAYGGGG